MKFRNNSCGTFIINDNWTFLFDGNRLVLSQEDLNNYRELSLIDDEIKILAYSFLTKESFYDFNETHGNLKVH